MNLQAATLNQVNPYLPFGDRQDAPFYGKDILSVKQFNHADLNYIFGVAHEMQEMVRRVGTFDMLKGKILANLFYEPSTRTSSSFTAAMERIPGHTNGEESQHMADPSFSKVEIAISRLSSATPGVKKTILDACAHCVLFDRTVSTVEAEMLRAVAYALDLPLPPFLMNRSKK